MWTFVRYHFQTQRIWFPLAVLLCVFWGAALVLQPIFAWLLLLGILGLASLQLPPYRLACLAVAAALFSRLFVSWRIAPGFINFFHFPLALMAFLAAVFPRHRDTREVENRLRTGIVLLAVLVFVSWLISGGEFLRPVLTWLLFVEPFLIIYAIIKSAPADKLSTLSRFAFCIAIVQIPFALWQAVNLGLGDVVQGTLIGQGAGHHILGAITLMSFISIASKSMTKKERSHIPLNLFLMVLLFMVPILSDAKQVIVAFVFSMLVLLWNKMEINVKTMMYTAFTLFLVFLASFFYTPLRTATDVDLVLTGLGGKFLAYKIISAKMSDFPVSFLIGLGPGNSVSRSALAAQQGYIRSLPADWVKFSLSPTTADILSSTAGFYLFASSSVWSGVSSWLGLFGDLGLAGVIAYCWLLWKIWSILSKRKTHWASSGKAILLMGIILGAMFSWLEMPEFTLPWALYMALGLVAEEDADSDST